MAIPCALIASCIETNPRDLVRQMLDVEALPEAEHVLEKIEAFPWHVDTKYYTADIRLCTTDTRTIGDEEFANSVQALVLIFDSKKETSFDQVKSWLPFAKEIDATVEMLACKRCEPDDEIAKARVQAWCLKNSFELVELEPETFSDEEEDDFPETTGVKRIVQALHAHMWPNLVMKDSPSFRSPYMNQMMATEAEHKRTHSESSAGDEQDKQPTPTDSGQCAHAPTDPVASQTHREQHPAVAADAATPHPATIPASPPAGATAAPAPSAGAAASSVKTSPSKGCSAKAPPGKAMTASTNPSKEEKDRANRETCQEASHETSQQTLDSLINNDDIALFSSLGNEDSSDETFEQLFEKMQIMKQRAENLPPDQRRAYAEKVAITFWKAIGGNEDEIEGISDDDDDP